MNALNAILHAQEAMVPAIEQALQRIRSVYGTPKQHQTEHGKYTTVPKVDEGINHLQCTYFIVFHYPYLTIFHTLHRILLSLSLSNNQALVLTAIERSDRQM